MLAPRRQVGRVPRTWTKQCNPKFSDKWRKRAQARSNVLRSTPKDDYICCAACYKQNYEWVRSQNENAGARGETAVAANPTDTIRGLSSNPNIAKTNGQNTNELNRHDTEDDLNHCAGMSRGRHSIPAANVPVQTQTLVTTLPSQSPKRWTRKSTSSLEMRSSRYLSGKTRPLLANVTIARPCIYTSWLLQRPQTNTYSPSPPPAYQVEGIAAHEPSSIQRINIFSFYQNKWENV